MALELSTIGVKIGYCAETSGRPTSGYTFLPEVKDIPALGTDVNALQSTTLDNSIHTYVEGVRGGSDGLALTVNDCPTFRTAWDGMVSAYNTAAGNSKDFWFEIQLPQTAGAMKSAFFTGKPCALGFGGASVDAVLENTATILPTSDITWATKSA